MEAHHEAAQHTTRLVVIRAGDSMRGSFRHGSRTIQGCCRDKAIGPGSGAFLRHLYPVVWAPRRDRRPDRGDTSARTLMGRLACDTNRAVCYRHSPRRVPPVGVITERGAYRTTASNTALQVIHHVNIGT